MDEPTQTYVSQFLDRSQWYAMCVSCRWTQPSVTMSGALLYAKAHTAAEHPESAKVAP